jgi:mitochondrial fission protein ELM1
VFCTSDSMSMLEEVIASGRPLIGLHPVKTEPNVNFRGFLAMRVKAGRLVRMPLADFAKAASDYPVPNTWNLVVPGMMEAGTRGLLEFLKL